MISRITLSFARLLRRASEEELNYAEFSGRSRTLLQQFIDDGVLEYKAIGRQRRKVFCPDSGNLALYLHNKFEIPSLERYIEFMEREEVQRSEAVRATSDSKARASTVFSGFFVNVSDPVSSELRGERFEIRPAQGAFCFVVDYETFRIPEDVTVTIVENYENFREVERQRHLFSGRVLFVWRYQNSSALVSWLNRLPNRWLHFGDFDPKGIHIYLSEFKRKIEGDRGKFFVPPGLESLLIQYGQRELYEKQARFLPSIDGFNDHETQSLVDLLKKHRRGLAQEILIGYGG